MSSPNESPIALPATLSLGTVAADPSPAQVLPPELIFNVAALAKPRSIVPLTCRQFHSTCTGGQQIQVAWRNCLLLWETGPPPTADPSAPLPRPYLTRFLTSLLPTIHGPGSTSTTTFSPTHPQSPDPILTAKYLDTLYAGPLSERARRARSQDRGVEAEAQHGLYDWWRPSIDAFILPIYCLRAGQLDLFRLCMTRLHASSLNIDGFSLRLATKDCGALFLDTRYQSMGLFDVYSVEMFNSGQVQFYQLVSTLAFLEWSLPAVNVLIDVYESTAAVAVQLALSHSTVQQIMYDSLHDYLPDCPSRIIDMFHWLWEHGQPMATFPLIRYIDPHTAPPGFVAKVLDQVDIQFWSENLEMADGLAFDELMCAVVIILAERFDQELLNVIVVEHDLMDNVYWAKLLVRNFDDYWIALKGFVQSPDLLHVIVAEAFDYALDVDRIANVPQLAHVLEEDCHVHWLDHVFQQLGHYFEPKSMNGLVSALDRSGCLLERTLLLGRVLSFFTTLYSTPYPSTRSAHPLCFLAASLLQVVLFDLPKPNANEPPHFIQSYRVDQLTALIISVLVATAEPTPVHMPLDLALAALNYLVPHVLQQLSTGPPTTLPSGFFHDVPPALRALCIQTIRDLLKPSAASDTSAMLVSHVAQLDTRMLAAAIAHDLDDEAADCAKALVPAHEQACARVCQGIMQLLPGGEEDEVAGYWTVAKCNDGVQAGTVQVMVKWMVEAKVYLGEDSDGKWLAVLEKEGERITDVFENTLESFGGRVGRRTPGWLFEP